jgi:tetratricopeptide (TPR) repeat protein
MRPRLGLALIAVLFASLMPLAPPALAQASDEEARAKELYRNGEQLYEEGLYENAIVAWELAYELSKRPLLLYNIANALERIGKWDDALRSINQYRALAPEDERQTLDRRMRAIERRIEDKRVAEEKRSAEEAIVRAKPNPKETPATVTLRPREKTPRPPQGAIALMALGGAGLASGGVLFGLALQARNEATGLCSSAGPTVLCPKAAAQPLARDSAFSLGADIGLIAGGVSLGAGIVLSILHSKGMLPRGGRQVLLVPSAGPGRASLSLQGTF